MIQTAYGSRNRLRAVYRRGLSVPRDVSLIGFDDLPSSTYRLPPLTSVRQSIGELGQRSARCMLDLLAGRRPKLSAVAVGIETARVHGSRVRVPPVRKLNSRLPPHEGSEISERLLASRFPPQFAWEWPAAHTKSRGRR